MISFHTHWFPPGLPELTGSIANSLDPEVAWVRKGTASSLLSPQ